MGVFDQSAFDNDVFYTTFVAGLIKYVLSLGGSLSLLPHPQWRPNSRSTLSEYVT